MSTNVRVYPEATPARWGEGRDEGVPAVQRPKRRATLSPPSSFRGEADACAFTENLRTTSCTGAALPKTQGRPHVPGPQPGGRYEETHAVRVIVSAPLRGAQPDNSCTTAKNIRQHLTTLSNHVNLEIETDELRPAGAFAPSILFSRGPACDSSRDQSRVQVFPNGVSTSQDREPLFPVVVYNGPPVNCTPSMRHEN